MTVERLISYWNQERHEVIANSLHILPTRDDLHVHVHRLIDDAYIFKSEESFARNMNYQIKLREIKLNTTDDVVPHQHSLILKKMPKLK